MSFLLDLAPTPALKLFAFDELADGAEELPGDSPDSGGPQISLDQLVDEFYEAYYRPICQPDASPKTIKDYRQTLKYWRQFSGRPTLRQLDEYHGAKFHGGLKTLRGAGGEPLAANTIRKHLGYIQAIVDRAGPRTRQAPEAAGLLERSIYIAKPTLVINEVADNWTVAEIEAVLAVCRLAPRPRIAQVAPGDWWRSAVLFAYNTGLRYETLRLLEWKWIEQDELGRWLRVPGKAIKRKRGLRIYLNEHAWRALQLVKGCDSPLLYPWPFADSWLHRTRRWLLKRSSLPPERRLGFRALRKALGTELAKINPLAAQMALGHSGRNVTRDHYVNKSVMIDAMKKLPQPKWSDELAERQRLLFD